MAEIVAALLGAEVLEALAEEGPQRRDRATARAADDGFQLGKGQLDRVQVRTVRRQKDEGRSGGRDRALHGGALMRAEVVRDHDVTAAQGGHEDLFDVGEETGPINRAFEDTRRGQAAQAQGGQKGARLPAGKGRVVMNADAPGRAAVPPQQIRGDARFIKEDEVAWIPGRGAPVPRGSGEDEVRSVVLAGPYGFF